MIGDAASHSNYNCLPASPSTSRSFSLSRSLSHSLSFSFSVSLFLSRSLCSLMLSLVSSPSPLPLRSAPSPSPSPSPPFLSHPLLHPHGAAIIIMVGSVGCHAIYSSLFLSHTTSLPPSLPPTPIPSLPLLFSLASVAPFASPSPVFLSFSLALTLSLSPSSE